MEELDVAAVKKRTIQGVFALISRTFVTQILSVTVNFLLTIFLTPSVFGVFYVVSAVISFLSYFSDIGLAAALVQKKEKLTEDDLRTTFTIQQGLIIILVAVALLGSGFISKFYNLEKEGVFLFQALVIAFFLSSLKTIPSIILERNLQFQKLVIPQIVETLFFNITVLVLAIKGFGVTSFTYAVLARGISGLITIYIICPWKIGLGFSKDSASKLLSFGIPFQTNSFLALLKDDLLTIYLGRILPIAQVGFIGFAQKWAFMPLRLFMDNVIRITFASFSRLQHDKNILGLAIEKSLFAISFFIFPSLTGLVILAPYFINLIPKYEKWEPALVSLSLFALSAILSSISTPLTNALNAIGKIRITLYLMIFWTVVTWVITPLFIALFGFNGVSIASFIIAFSVVIVVYIAKKYINFRVSEVIKFPVIATCLMGIFMYFLSPVIVKNIPLLFLMVIMGGSIYFSAIYLLAKKQLLDDVQLIRENLKK
ncbi:MAG: oligosaccharide flippase family protein [Patescibacteria group bacterium]|nr:oligosaccharide flippase family protein [Actinomycetota bacterium]MCL5969950.1 oligosaccharide flippase family protein [Patescibacteria group bacterium]